jgi:hypothetical protein
MRFSLPLLLALSTAPLLADDTWISFGQNAAVHKTGNTVSLDYKIVRGQVGLAILQTPEGKLARMTHLQLRVKSDVTTIVGVMLSEKKPGGGDYVALCWSPQDRWQQLDLTPADFSVNDGPNDPKDADGRLDLDQVQAVAVFDAGQFFSQAPADEKSPVAIKPLSGDHKLLLEDLRIVSENAKAQGEGTVIDDFHRGFVTWFSPVGKPALEFHYQQEPYRFTILMHALGQAKLNGTKELIFDVASDHDAHMIVSLEGQKTAGRAPRYNHDFTLDAGQSGHMVIPFSEFTLAEDSPPDPDGHLEVAKLRSIGFIDIIGTLEGAKARNTFWLADLRAK